MEMRAPGRPSRSIGVVGRQKIIEDIRDALRRRANVDLSRKELARAIGITPALITYYFSEKDQLVEEVAVPIVEAHRIALSAIVNGPHRPEQQLRQVISVLVELHGKDRMILDLYKTLEVAHPEDYAELATMTAILSDFFNCWRGVTHAIPFEAIVLQGAVRGMCDFLEHVEASEERKSLLNVPKVPDQALDPLYALFMGAPVAAAPLCA